MVLLITFFLGYTQTETVNRLDDEGTPLPVRVTVPSNSTENSIAVVSLVAPAVIPPSLDTARR